jgi:DNA integrity scanning protein DisA with diadenylate cyclase activity
MPLLRFFSWPSITGILLMLGLFAGEIYTHILGNVAYVAIAAYALWRAKDHQEIHVIVIGATVLLIVGYFFAISMQQPADQATFLVNRASAIVVIWFAHYFTLRYRKTRENENRQRIELEERKLDQERLRSRLEIYQAIACNFPVGWIGILDGNLHT